MVALVEDFFFAPPDEDAPEEDEEVVDFLLAVLFDAAFLLPVVAFFSAMVLPLLG